jgi:sec-independent protein translocase protein TatA
MFGNTIGWPEIILLAVVILVLFGVGRISKIFGELGSGIRSFKEGYQGTDKAKGEKAAEKPEDQPKS